MGEVVMKKFFDKENFIPSTFNKNQRIQSLIVSIAIIVLFILSSLTFFNAFYAFSDFVGSIVCRSIDVAFRDMTRSLPLIFSFLMSLWGLLLFHACFRNVSDQKRIKSLKKNAFTLLGFALANFTAIIVMLIIGKFHSLVEGSPSPLYPLDSILYSFVYIILGVVVLIYLHKYQEKLPYIVPSRGPIVIKARGVYCAFVSIWLLITLFCFSTFFIGLFIMDFQHGYAFFSISLLIVYCVNSLFIAFWEFYYNELKEEKKKEFLLPLSLVGLGVSILTITIYLVGLGLNLDGPSNVGFGVLPVTFAASTNIPALIVVVTPLIVSIVAFIKALLARKK